MNPNESHVISWTILQLKKHRVKSAWSRSVVSIAELMATGLTKEQAKEVRAKARREYCKLKMQELRMERKDDIR